MADEYDFEVAKDMLTHPEKYKIPDGNVVKEYDEKTLEKLNVLTGTEVICIENTTKSAFPKGRYRFDIRTRHGLIELTSAKLSINGEEVLFEQLGLGIPIRMKRVRLISSEYKNDEYNLVLSDPMNEMTYVVNSKCICLDDLVESG